MIAKARVLMQLVGGRAPGTAHAASTLVQATRVVDALQSREIPEVLRLRDEMYAQASEWWGYGLETVLRAHLHAVDAVQFGLLVPQGLRAAPNRRQEDRFLCDVEGISMCTEITWFHVREFLIARHDSEAVDPLTGDFIMQARAAQRQVAETRILVETLRQDLDSRQDTVTSDTARRALSELSARTAEVDKRLASMEQLCVLAREVQRAAYSCADERRALAVRLRSLAEILGGGLLARLRVLVEPGAAVSAKDLDEAVRARDTLRTQMNQAVLQAGRLCASHESLLERLEAMAST